jgi:hypothetical protein
MSLPTIVRSPMSRERIVPSLIWAPVISARTVPLALAVIASVADSAATMASTFLIPPPLSADNF